MKYMALLAMVLFVPSIAFAHGGGLNSEGCHNDRKKGTYHCHRSSYTPKTATSYSSSRDSSFTNYNRGSSNSQFSKNQIYSIQTLLKGNGYSVGAVDGLFGNNTRRAIESFQRDNHLVVTGLPSDQLVLKLRDKSRTFTSSTSSYTRQPQRKSSNVYYRNCTAARNAGASNIRRGEAGYGSHLDRDNDGIACER